jgi:ribonuclease HI
MRVTIITDASYCSATKCGGWAVWAASERGTIKSAGGMKLLVENSSVAELMAIGNGLAFAVIEGVVQPGDEVLIQGDNQSALRAVRKPHKARGQMAEVVEKIVDLRDRRQLKLVTKHVRAHSGRETRRTWVHDWCDREARKAMRQSRRERGLDWGEDRKTKRQEADKW